MLVYPSQVVNIDVLNSVPTWEESLINLDYFLAWTCLHLKLIKSKQSGHATAKSSNPNLNGLNDALNHSIEISQSEGKLKISENYSNLLNSSLQIFSSGQSNTILGSGDS